MKNPLSKKEFKTYVTIWHGRIIEEVFVLKVNRFFAQFDQSIIYRLIPFGNIDVTK